MIQTKLNCSLGLCIILVALIPATASCSPIPVNDLLPVERFETLFRKYILALVDRWVEAYINGVSTLKLS